MVLYRHATPSEYDSMKLILVRDQRQYMEFRKEHTGRGILHEAVGDRWCSAVALLLELLRFLRQEQSRNHAACAGNPFWRYLKPTVKQVLKAGVVIELTVVSVSQLSKQSESFPERCLFKRDISAHSFYCKFSCTVCTVPKS
jgi:hypothetical protein